MAYNRRSRKILLAVLIAVIVGGKFIIAKERVIAHECVYRFSPEALLREVYGLADYPWLRTCTVMGTAYQDQNYKLGFDIYQPEILNEEWNILSDSGRMIFKLESTEGWQTLFFDNCALEYKNADLFSKQFVIQNNTNPKDGILGYACIVYVSSAGNQKSEAIPLSSNSVTVNTRDGKYYLKAISMFFAYKQDTYVLQDEVVYQIKDDKGMACEFTIQRVKEAEE